MRYFTPLTQIVCRSGTAITEFVHREISTDGLKPEIMSVNDRVSEI